MPLAFLLVGVIGSIYQVILKRLSGEDITSCYDARS